MFEFGHLKVAYSSVHLCDGNGDNAKYTILNWPDLYVQIWSPEDNKAALSETKCI